MDEQDDEVSGPRRDARARGSHKFRMFQARDVPAQ